LGRDVVELIGVIDEEQAVGVGDAAMPRLAEGFIGLILFD